MRRIGNDAIINHQTFSGGIFMDWKKLLFDADEKPLDRFADGYSHTSVFRKIAFIGDSLSSGEFETLDADGNRGYHDMFEYSWGQYIARKNGLTAYNFSRGGMTAKEYTDSFAEENGFWDKDKACQAYVIALGVNDVYNQGMEIGSIGDIDPENFRNNKPTFVGYYAAIVSRYKEISPDAKFFFVTFPDENEPQKEAQRQGVADALRSLAGYFSNSYVIDLYRYGPVYDEEFRKNFFMHGHMNASGYILTARMIDSYIDYIVRKNPDDFSNVCFISTDIKYNS